MQIFSRSFRASCLFVVVAVSGWLNGPASLQAQSAAAARAAVKTASPSGLWQDLDEKPLLAARGGLSARVVRNGVVPSQYRTLHLDRAKLAALLDAAPEEGVIARARAAGAPAAAVPAPVELELPIPHSAAYARFTVESSPIMEPGLAVRYPSIHTFIAQGIDHPELTARLDVTPLGFHAQILSPAGQIVVDPYFLDGSDPATSIAFYKRDYASSAPMPCLYHGEGAERAALPLPEATSPTSPTGAKLRVYRLVIGTTGEYSVKVGGGDLTMTLGAVVTSVNRVDALYERDFAIRMVLVANEDKMIYTNASTDPYTNTNPNSLLTQNKTTCNSVIGTANYDIGHVFSTAGGGLAALGVVCGTNKAQGETGITNPVGDPYDIDYVAHEMGHQFGANHPFNATTGSCSSTNRNAATAYEIGSGTTIMAYAGICAPQDLAPHSDDYFHTISFDEINTYTTTGTGKNASQTLDTGNTPPALSAPTDATVYNIPVSTPFILTAAATDANNDRLTYCWEEFDLGAAQDPTASPRDNGSSTIFRSFAPTTDPTRIFPSLTYILNNANVPPATIGTDAATGIAIISGEFLPATTRTMLYRCTVRDNRTGGGGSNYATATVKSTTAAGPFAITAPNAAATFAAGASVPVTWSVAGTTASPVSCANVKISLSTDGGLTFPYVLASSVPNSGTATVTLPTAASVVTTQGRIKVEAVGNIFFDIDDANLTITSTTTPPTFTATGSGITVVRGTPTTVTSTVGTAAAGSNTLSSVSISGVPDGATVTGAIVGGNVQLTASAVCRVTTTLTTRAYPINVTVTDTAGATSSVVVNLNIVPNPSPTLGTYANTIVGQNGAVTVTPSAAPADSNGNLIATPVSLSPTTALPTGVTVTLNQTTGAATFAAASTATLGTTTLRLQVQDACGATTETTFTLTVTAPTTSAPVFSSTAPAGSTTAGTAYSYTFTASGTPTPTYSVTAGTLPPGLSLNATTGVLSGTPTTPGAYSGIQVTASNGTSPNATQTFSLTVVNTQSNYAASYGLTGANAAPGADPDGDGLSNLAEYALNLNPAQSDAGSGTAATPQSQVAVRTYGTSKFLSIRFTRVPLATDVTYLVESSADLVTWTTVATSSGGAVLSGAGVVSDDASSTAPHTVEVRDTVATTDAPDQRRFLRVRFTQP